MTARRFNYRHLICVGFILGSIAFIPFFFRYAHLRIAESAIALGGSAKFYVSELFDLDLSGKLTVNNFTEVPYTLPFGLPRTWDEFAANMKNYWATFFSSGNLQAYMGKVGDVFVAVLKVLMLLFPVVFIFVILHAALPKTENNDYGAETKALKAFKRFEYKVCRPVKMWLQGFVHFVREHKIYVCIFLAVWFYSFNGVAIVLSILAYLLFFITALKPATIYIQVCKLLMDLTVVPTVAWILFSLWAINKLRRYIGYNRLAGMEGVNQAFVDDRSIVFMLCGSMGKKKTTLATDMALSQEVMFREKAFEKICECDLKFPYFPWLKLELEIKRAIESHYIYNLATVKQFVRCCRRAWHRKRFIFGYDYARYGTTFNNSLEILDVWDVIETYALLYFIYVIESSLLLANYSIRTDAVLADSGNFPMWDNDYFRRDPALLAAASRHAHILDFDALRLGKRLVEDSKTADSFDFGCVNITEVGKERGNQKTNQTRNKRSKNAAPEDELANQDNDLFNVWLKMIRHSGTVDFYPFVRVICDEQRPESLGADARELAEIVHIDNCSEFKLAMPFFFFEDFFINLFLGKFQQRYYTFRHDRGDMSLPMYLYHGVISLMKRYQTRVYNTFGFFKVDLKVEAGTQDGELKDEKYYLMNKKIYSRRFATDAFSDFFHRKSLRSTVGLGDLPEYAGVKATLLELAQQSSYFVRDITTCMRDKSDER